MVRKKKVDEFLKDASTQPVQPNEKYREARGRRGSEKELWQKWDAGGRKPQDLRPLLKSIEPLINSETRKRMQGLGGSIPQAALKNELRNHAVKAIETYKPEKAQLSTHIVTNFQRVSDFVAGGRNQLYMPKKDINRHQQFMSARDQLSDELGREPTPEEIQAHLPGVSLRHVKRMTKGFSPEAFADMGNDFDEARHKVDARDAYLLMRPTMTEEQRLFAERHYPPAGERQRSVAAIARELKIPQHKAYQIKTEVERRLASVLRKE
jgi:DNA-directed RNA polymerase specialized sigma subunit